MKYLPGTKDTPLTLEGDNACIIKWWVDASFAVHPDMKSHTGQAIRHLNMTEAKHEEFNRSRVSRGQRNDATYPVDSVFSGGPGL
jgi:hypothetical protein